MLLRFAHLSLVTELTGRDKFYCCSRRYGGSAEEQCRFRNLTLKSVQFLNFGKLENSSIWLANITDYVTSFDTGLPGGSTDVKNVETVHTTYDTVR